MSSPFTGGAEESIFSSNNSNKNTFFSHVFSTTEEGKAEILNTVQYSLMGVLPIVLLNKLVQKFIPEADAEKSTWEILAEILFQIIIMFCGIILIHRIITYIPTYSEFKYENLTLTNVILAFLVIILSIQTKLGIKVNILVDRLSDMWNGEESESSKPKHQKKHVRMNQAAASRHVPSQGDYLESSQTDMFPPAPLATTRQSVDTNDYMMRGGSSSSSASSGHMDYASPIGPIAANSLLGSAFGAMF
jgi:hypothetical protein